MSAPPQLKAYVLEWVESHPLSAVHIDCAIAVMLKILDGKCKMKPSSKVVMEVLYDAIKNRNGKLLGDDIHALIERARRLRTAEIRNHVYEQRLLAETMISRPVMKGFKAMIREHGLFDSPAMAQLVVEG